MIKNCKSHKMRTSSLVFPLFFISVYASGDFSILNSPQSIEFKGDEKLDTENVCDVLSASLGFSVRDTVGWSGLYVHDPFDVAQAAIVVLAEGVDKLPLKGKATTYPLTGYSAQESLDDLTSILEKYNSLAVDLDLNQGPEALLTYSDILGDLSIPSSFKSKGNLKPSLHSEDKLFLQQIAIIETLAEKLQSIAKKPILITLRLSLNPIITTHGVASPAVTEALKLLAGAIEKLEDESKKVYKGNSLFTVITEKSENQIRSKRQAEQKPTLNAGNINLATYYDEDYPVIFNIILWFGVVFAFSLLAISYSIATMDPGRDSIIYRMTSTRMKKDN